MADRAQRELPTGKHPAGARRARSSGRRAATWLLVAALSGGCGGSAEPPDRAPGLELVGLGEDPGERALAAALEARFADEPWTLSFQVAAAEGEAPPTEPPGRLPGDFAEWGERPGQWFVGRVGYRHPGDLLRATRREGTRWTVDCVVRDPGSLALAPERCAPATEPGIDALRRGELELSWAWRGAGAGELRFDRRVQLQLLPAGEGELVSREGLRTRLPAGEAVRTGFADCAAELARGRWQARSLAGVGDNDLEVWNARPSWTFDEWVARTGSVRPRLEASTPAVLLALEGHRAADLREVGARGEWTARSGAAADPRLEAAVVSASSATWGGSELEPWIARLHRAGLSASLDELFAPWLPGAAPKSSTATGAASPSPLIAEPQLAFATRWLALNEAANAPDFLASLWNGRVPLELPDAELESRYQASLTALAEAQAFDANAAAGGPLPWGVCLRLPDDPAAWLGAPALAALEDARAVGARQVQVDVVLWESARGYDQRPGVSELQWLADRCGELGLGLCLSAHFLDAPGRHLLGVEFSGGAEAFATDLDRLESSAVHAALLAERVGAAWLCLTSDTHAWLRTRESGYAEEALDEFGRERMAQAADRWPGLVARLRGCTGAGLTVSVSTPLALAQFGEWELLDAASYAFFPAHLSTPEGYLRPGDLEVKLGQQLESLDEALGDADVPLVLWGAGVSASELGRTRADLRGGALDPRLPAMFTAALRAALGAGPERGLLLWDWPVGPDDQPRGLGLRGRVGADVLAR